MSDDVDMDLDDDADDAEAARPVFKRKEFLAQVAARCGAKQKDIRGAADATLAVLAEALAGGHDLALLPLGKVKVVREKAKPKGVMLTCRIAVPAAGAATDDED